MPSATQFLNDSETQENSLVRYQSEGYVILNDVFDNETLMRMRAAWHSISEERARKGKKPFATLLMPHISYPAIEAIVTDPTLVKSVQTLLHGNVDLIQSQLMWGVPGARGFSPHQDNFYNRPDPSDGIIAAWIALEDVEEVNGGVAVYPASHKTGLATARKDWFYLFSRAFDIARSLLRLAIPSMRKQTADSGVIERFIYADSTQFKPVIHSMRAGSVLFMHGDLIHHSAPNKTQDRFRRSLLTNYVRQGTVYASGKLTGRVALEVSKTLPFAG